MLARSRVWVTTYTVLAQIVAVLWIALTLLYNHNGEFHRVLHSHFNSLPLLVQEIIELIAIPLAIAIGHKWAPRRGVGP